MRDLNINEMNQVAGGQSIVEMIEEAFPGGVWIGNSYFPNGVPSAPPSGPVTTGW